MTILKEFAHFIQISPGAGARNFFYFYASDQHTGPHAFASGHANRTDDGRNEDIAMAKILVLYYSSYGHTERMAQAVAEGARLGGGRVDIKRIPETAPPEIVEKFNFKINNNIPVVQVPELENYDAIIFGVPVRFGRTPSQLGAFLDSAGSLWVRGALAGKIAAAFTSSSHAQAGQEATLIGMLITCLHLGMITVGVPWCDQGEIKAPNIGTACPYGASTVVGFDNTRDVDVIELEIARIQGKYVAEVAAKHFG